MVKVAVWKAAPALLVAATLAVLTAASASARTTTVGLGGWQVQSSAQASQDGAQISTPGFATGSWLHVRPDDGGAVGTEVNALVQTGALPERVLLDDHEDVLRLHGQHRAGHDP